VSKEKPLLSFYYERALHLDPSTRYISFKFIVDLKAATSTYLSDLKWSYMSCLPMTLSDLTKFFISLHELLATTSYSAFLNFELSSSMLSTPLNTNATPPLLVEQRTAGEQYYTF
jgi:hypothetical protein